MFVFLSFRTVPVCILAGLLALALLLSGCGAVPSVPEVPTSAEPASDTDTETVPETGLRLSGSFVIMRAYNSTAATKAANYVRDCVQDLYGVTLSIVKEKPALTETEADPEERVILVGETGHAASAAEMEGLRADDYLYSVPDDRTVVLGGWSESSLLSAATAFFEDLYGYTGPGTGHQASPEPGTRRVFEVGTYPVRELSLNGIPARELTILYSGNANECTTAGKQIVKAVSSLSGYRPKLLAADGAEASAPGILLCAGVGTIEYSIGKVNGSVVITAPSNQLKTAVTKFLEAYLTFEEDPPETLDVVTDDLTRYAYVDGVKYHNGIVLQSRTDTEVKPGITFTELTYANKKDKPVLVRAVIVEKGAAQVMVGTPKGQTTEIDSVQTPRGQARAAEEKWGVNVIAAANGDLFKYFYPLGAMYQNGVKLYDKHEGEWTKHCFAVRKDGSFYVGTFAGIPSDQVDQMVGGEGIILDKGQIVQCINDDFFVSNHPRTAVGYDDEGTLYLIEIDGRQSELSNGASFMDMALIFKYLGATNAVNLDGGGSSALFLENQETGELELVSSPSDEGNEVRACINSVLIIDPPAD